MEKVRVVGNKTLRYGITTGTCAAAAAKAAALMLLEQKQIHEVSLITPSKIEVNLSAYLEVLTDEKVICYVIKDAGDDPDVTHHMRVYAEASLAVGEGDHRILGGIGIGVVKKPGLQVSVGLPAINPVPMAMIKEALNSVSTKPIQVTISAPEGVELAKRTFNPRLGIEGGISILGTTGIVEPMSEKAIIDTIQTEIAQRAVENKELILLTPGNYGLSFINHNQMVDGNPVKISNFIGEALDFCHHYGFKRVLLVGHMGKLCKVAGGIFNTHSRIADGRNEIVAAHFLKAHHDIPVFHSIMSSLTTDTMVEAIEMGGYEDFFETFVETIAYRASQRLWEKIPLGVILFTTQNRILAVSEGARCILNDQGWHLES